MCSVLKIPSSRRVEGFSADWNCVADVFVSWAEALG